MESQLSLLTRENNALKTKISDVKGQNSSLESQLLLLTREKNALIAKLSDANTHLQELPVLQEKLTMIEEQLDKERWEWRKAKRQLTTDHSNELTKLKQELGSTKTSLSWYQLSEVEALQKQVLAEKQLERERREWRDTKEQMTSEHAKLINGLWQELQDLTEKLRQSESVQSSYRSSVSTEDSGVWESLSDQLTSRCESLH